MENPYLSFYQSKENTTLKHDYQRLVSLLSQKKTQQNEILKVDTEQQLAAIKDILAERNVDIHSIPSGVPVQWSSVQQGGQKIFFFIGCGLLIAGLWGLLLRTAAGENTALSGAPFWGLFFAGIFLLMRNKEGLISRD